MRRAVTLIELLIVIVLLGIVAGLALPSLGDSMQLRLREAARLLAADIEFTQSEAIAHADVDVGTYQAVKYPRLIKFDPATERYWIAASSTPDAPITDEIRKEPFLVQYGSGRASGLGGVTIQSVSLDGDNTLQFDVYGSPDQATPAIIRLAAGGSSMTITVAAGTGEVSITTP